jgi:hypothetical protein
MGIETALLIGGLANAGASAYSANKQAKAAAAAVQKPEPPPQASKQPKREAAVTANAAAAGMGGAMAGNSSTFLTGPQGVDPSTLNLGRNSLLGQ